MNRTLSAIADANLKTPGVVGCYVNLLIHHDRNGSLPLDKAALGEIAGAGDRWDAAWPAIRGLFYAEGGALYANALRAKAARAGGVPCTRDTLLSVMKEWTRVLPELPAPQVATDARFVAFRTRWQEASQIPTRDMPNGYATEADGVRWWAGLFGSMRDSKFLMGRSSEWRASFDFILQSKSFAKAVEGAYS